MDLSQVSRALGENLVAGCPVEPATFEHDMEPTYLALGRTRFALFAYRPGAFAFAPGKTLAAHELADVFACEFMPARTGSSRLIITTRAGVRYDLTVALAHRGTANRMSEAMEEHLRSNAA